MTEARQRLVRALRDDPQVRTHFYMRDYLVLKHMNISLFHQGAPIQDCGAVGCIAGWTVLLHDADNIDFEEAHVSDIGGRAADLLGIDYAVSDHLFVPPNWQADCSEYDLFEWHYRPLWDQSDNYRADLDTVQKMHDWAVGIPQRDMYDRVTPDIAATAIECLDEHPGYVDWREAFEREGAL